MNKNCRKWPFYPIFLNFFKAGTILQVEITIIIYENVGCKEIFWKFCRLNPPPTPSNWSNFLNFSIASGFITDAGPQFWKNTLNSGKVPPPIKTTVFEGVKIIFGHKDRDTGTAMYSTTTSTNIKAAMLSKLQPWKKERTNFILVTLLTTFSPLTSFTQALTTCGAFSQRILQRIIFS